MIYYYQIVNKPLTHKILSGETCPVCNKKDTLQLTLYMRYISALVPFYGMGRRTSVHCTVCNHIVKSVDASIFAKKNYSANIEREIKNLRATHKRTLWQLLYPWTACWLILGLIAMGLTMKFINQVKANNTKEILASPKPNDIYKSNWDEEANREPKGALVKVVRVNGDTLVIVHSKKMIDGIDLYSQKGWDKISDEPESFDPIEYKVKLSSFLTNTEFEEFDTKRQIPFGSVLGLGRSNYEFEVVERK